MNTGARQAVKGRSVECGVLERLAQPLVGALEVHVDALLALHVEIRRRVAVGHRVAVEEQQSDGAEAGQLLEARLDRGEFLVLK